jgi:O-antigen/teichoic acid export membrane protein
VKLPAGEDCGPVIASRGPRLRREAIVVVLGQVGVAGAGLAGLRLLTTLLSPEEFGRLALGLSIAALFQQVAFGPLVVASLRYAAGAFDEGSLDRLVGTVDRLLFQLAVVSVAVSSLAAVVLPSAGLLSWVPLGGLCLWFSIASAAFSTRLSVDAALRRRELVAIMQVGAEVGRFALASAVIVLLGQPSAGAAMAGFAAALTMAAFVQRRRMATSGTLDIAWRGVLVAFARPLAVTGGLTWAQMASDRWSLNALMSAAHVGAYSAIYQIAIAPFTLVGTTVQQLLAPIVFRMAGKDGDRAAVSASHLPVLSAVTILLVLTAAGSLVAWLLHEEIFHVLVGPAFATYSRLLPLGVVAGGLLAAGQVVSTTIMSRGVTSELMVPKAVTALFGAALNVIGAWLYGVVGVILATIAFALIFFVWMYRMAAQPVHDASQPVESTDTERR